MTPPEESLSAGYEQRDTHLGKVLVTGLALLGVMALGLVVSRWMFDAFEAGDPALRERHPMADVRLRTSEPVLQAAPAGDLASHRAWEERTLSTYGWIDPNEGVVRLPVERAAELALEEGFPVRDAEERR